MRQVFRNKPKFIYTGLGSHMSIGEDTYNWSIWLPRAVTDTRDDATQSARLNIHAFIYRNYYPPEAIETRRHHE